MPATHESQIASQVLPETHVPTPIRSSRVSQPPSWLQDFSCNTVTIPSQTKDVCHPLFRPKDFQDLQHEQSLPLQCVIYT